MFLKEGTLAVAIVAIWALNMIVQKIAVEHVSLSVLNFLRFSLLIPFLAIYRKPPDALWKILICSMFWNVLNFLLVGMGLKVGVGAGEASFLFQTNTLFGFMFCAIFFKTWPTPYQILGTLVSISGIYWLSCSSQNQGISIEGIVYIIGAAASWGLGFALLKKLQVGRSISHVVWMSFFSAMIFGIYSIYEQQPSQIFYELTHIPLFVWIGVFFSALVVTLAAGALWIKLSQEVESTSLIPYMLLLPLFGGVFSYLFLGEGFSINQGISAVIILLGVSLSQGLLTYRPTTKLGDG